MGAHRFWRIDIQTNSYPPGYPTLAEVAFATAPGGASVIGGGAAIASFVYKDFAASNACDGDPGTYWAAQILPSWWGYDFGAGNAVDVREVRITARSDAGDAFGPGWSSAPAIWTLGWSDDGTAWTATQNYSSAPWTAGATQNFAVPAPAPAQGCVLFMA